jgi:hypothetical protein
MREFLRFSLAPLRQEVNPPEVPALRRSVLALNLVCFAVFSMSKTLYMVVEHFKNKDAVPVYRRFRDRGHLAPEGLFYVSSWVDDQLERCYQLMETHDRKLLEEWMANWNDLVEFEVYPVITSADAARTLAPRL